MKTDRYRLEHIAEIGEQLLGVVERNGITSESINCELETQWLITTPLYNIGEQTNCLSDELTSKHPDVPWAQVAGLRHRLVHNYEGTNWSMISEVVLVELRPFINQIHSILDAMPDSSGDTSAENEQRAC